MNIESSIESTLGHLRKLVAWDTQNPPRAITADHGLFQYLREVLEPGFRVMLTDLGDGHVSLLAIRGMPTLLFNVHLDTVPVGEGWQRPALQLTVEEDRAYGRGVCDIKGAAACLLSIAQACDLPMALLFTTDEEGANGCCIRTFLETPGRPQFRQVVVAEPTLCQAVLSHRGYLSVKGRFTARPGHSSETRALAENSNHQVCRWAHAALNYAAKLTDSGQHSCFNIGRIEGGQTSNVITPDTFVHWSARLPPGASNEEFMQTVLALTPDMADSDWWLSFTGPPLPDGGHDTDAATEFARKHQLDLGSPVDFWTEASLFAAAGIPALVLGPGDIRQAHSSDEWVALEQLQQAETIYSRLVEGDTGEQHHA